MSVGQIIIYISICAEYEEIKYSRFAKLLFQHLPAIWYKATKDVSKLENW